MKKTMSNETNDETVKKLVDKFYQQITNFETSAAVGRTLGQIKSLIPINDQKLDPIFQDKSKFNDFVNYISSIEVNTEIFIAYLNEQKNLMNITKDEKIIDYWNKFKLLFVLKVIFGGASNNENGSFGSWFRPIINDLKKIFDRYKIPSNFRNISTNKENLNTLSKLHEEWFLGKSIDIVGFSSDPISQRCAELLNSNKYDSTQMIKSLMFTLDFQISSAILNYGIADEKLRNLFRFYKFENNKYPSMIMQKLFPKYDIKQQPMNYFPNKTLQLNIIYNTKDIKGTKKFSPNYLTNDVHPSTIEKVVLYLTDIVEQMRIKQKSFNFEFKFIDNDEKLISFVLDAHLIIFDTMMKEINVEPLNIIDYTSVVFPSEWKSLHPFYFDNKNNSFKPQRFYPPDSEQNQLPSYFVYHNLFKEKQTFRELYNSLDMMIPMNQITDIFVNDLNDNFWYDSDQVYHVFRFSKRPDPTLSFQIIDPKDQVHMINQQNIQMIYQFEQDFRTLKTKTNPFSPDHIIWHWAQQMIDNDSIGIKRVDLLFDVMFFVASKFNRIIGNSKDIAQKIGVSPSIVEILTNEIVTLPSTSISLTPSTDPSALIVPTFSGGLLVTDYFSTKRGNKGHRRRSPSRRRRSPIRKSKSRRSRRLRSPRSPPK